MKKIIPIVLFFIIALLSSTVMASSVNASGNDVAHNAANDVATGAEAVKNTAENVVRGTGNVVEGAGNAISQGAERAVEGAANVVEKAGNGLDNAGRTIANGTENTVRTTSDSVSVNETGASSFLGLSRTAWVWIIIIVLGAILIVLLTKYMKDKEDAHH